MNKSIKGISNEAMRALLNHEWKGEVRELENTIERAVIFCKEDFIQPGHLPPTFRSYSSGIEFPLSGSLEDAVRRFEKDAILKALENNENNKEKTAETLQVGLSTLYRKMKELDIKL